MAEHNSSKYYVPESSPWPILGSVGLFLIAIGAANFIQQSTEFGRTPGPWGCENPSERRPSTRSATVL